VPTYAYACTECSNRFEVQQAFTDASLTECPECSGRLRKLFNSVGIVFKGSGFYRTDSRTDAKSSSGDPAPSGAKESSGGTDGGGAKDSGAASGAKDPGSKDSAGSSGSSGSSGASGSSGGKDSGTSAPKAPAASPAA
jgi:putative FmdB family regulatory protein